MDTHPLIHGFQREPPSFGLCGVGMDIEVFEDNGDALLSRLCLGNGELVEYETDKGQEEECKHQKRERFDS